MEQTTNPQQANSQQPAFDMEAFRAWCKELNVTMLSNKDGMVKVLVGNHEKWVKLDRPFPM